MDTKLAGPPPPTGKRRRPLIALIRMGDGQIQHDCKDDRISWTIGNEIRGLT